MAGLELEGETLDQHMLIGALGDGVKAVLVFGVQRDKMRLVERRTGWPVLMTSV